MKTLTEYANEEVKNHYRIHEGETEQIIDCTIDGGQYVAKTAIEKLKWRMNPDNLVSASEYWYRCAMHDAIKILEELSA